MIKSLREFIKKNNFNIEVWKLFNDFKNIKDETFFVLYIRLYINEKEVINKDYSQICKILNDILLEQYNVDKKIINNITNNYEVISTVIYDNVGKYTFNYKVNPKVCKYCNNSDKKYFSNESHIIPENIGGHLIDSLECDKCNSWFNENIEQDFSKFLDVQKTLFGIKGKIGIPKIISDDFNAKYDNLNGKDRLTFTIKNPKITPYNIQQYKFEITKDINLYNLYKTLCKIALGVIDYKQIEIFSDTIKWIKDLNANTKIPIVILNNHINIIDYLNKPYVYVYIRKNNDYNIPYTCAELNCRFMSFYYIIPFSKNDRNNFLNKDEIINLFKDIFYIKSDNYRILDCNENKKTELKNEINLDLK
ncbi:HNH endonuclease [Brachyspira pilosicoli]|nr:HNH endonuclease [Brachyspira pilosicoli]